MGPRFLRDAFRDAAKGPKIARLPPGLDCTRRDLALTPKEHFERQLESVDPLDILSNDNRRAHANHIEAQK